MKNIHLLLLVPFLASAQLRDTGPRYSPFDLMYYGAACDGSTDDTTALNAAIAYVITAGGTLSLPQGKTCRINGQIAIPNDGSLSRAYQKSLRITGSGAGADAVDGGGSGTPSASGGTILDMRYSSGSATDGKFLTLGVGKLEIDHVFLKDLGTDTTPFVYTTNTVLLFHHNTVYGTGQGQDVIVLGGTVTTIGPAANAAFQGYGTVIDSNFVDKVARLAYLRTFANGIQIVNNTVWNSSAGTSPIELDGSAGTSEGNYIAGNLLELVGYTYGVKLTKAFRNMLVANTFWDPTVSTLSFINAGASATANVFMIGENVGATPVTGASACDNALIDGRGARLVGTGCSCADTTTDIGKIWFDTSTTTTALKVCMYVSGTLQWVTK